MSNIVHELVLDVDVVPMSRKHKKRTGTRSGTELGFRHYSDFASSLKKVTFKCINRSDIVQMYEKQGEKVIKGLFEAFMDNNFNNNNKLLPIEYRGYEQKRAITDYIAGMMDTYALKTYEKIYGKGALNKIYEPGYFKSFNNRV